ncbi:hypothetical protein LEP1GSC050_0028 [Leptospira phage vB_LbrZ_5399-LE1]|uniref:RDD domain protein n=1 Tax=Leptospira inadai serovar Lyme TaxID=293084 RepID=A0ABX4YGH8_9LEPT|nr:hypothetical protein LEP1GSC050_0028 [Leptospira phage vB_LbrZ_5399-LE1]AGS80815.1 hypothetical protein LEP1GSC047_0843 [Leptospira phage vB_LinZ_10-LE1]PNV74294.1 hypothetical protein BES34_013995 [Leptospira inadai serovar Lyme]
MDFSKGIGIWLVSGLSFWISNEIFELLVKLKSHEYFGKRREFRIGTRDFKNLILCLITGPVPILFWAALKVTKGLELKDGTIFRILFPKTKKNEFERETKEKQ